MDQQEHPWIRVVAAKILILSLALTGLACVEEIGGNESRQEALEVELAVDGQAKWPIVIGDKADPVTVEAAQELAQKLEEISGAEFAVIRDERPHGIALGAADEFIDLPDDVEFGDGPFEREDYLLRSHREGLWLVGATPQAARFALWDLLYRLGHRQFFPTQTWEIVPQKERISIAVNSFESPDYYSRQAPRGAMRMDLRPWAEEAWQNWQIRNRTAPTFELATGHAYDSIIAENQAEFDANPDYWGEIDGERSDEAQPNVANPEVQQLFIDYAREQLAANPEQGTVALDPRDGNYWSESSESRAIGGPSEQAVFMANKVAQALVEDFGPETYVGMYGYSHHSPPPEIDVHPNVVVSLATEYIRGGYTFEDMLDGWSQQANMIGIREYYGLWEWHKSLPGHGAHAADLSYLQETLPYFHERGARFINAESNDTWGGYGLGYYVAARLLWDVEQAQEMEALVDDFLDKAFGSARAPMAKFYELIDGGAKDPHVPGRARPLNDDMVGRMYRHLDDARVAAADDEAVLARINELVLYTRYVELYRRFDRSEGPSRQAVFDELVSFAWRIRKTMMAESVELTRYIDREVRTDEHLEWGEGYTRNGPADRHRVDSDKPFADAEIEAIVAEGITNHPLLDLEFDPWVDSGDLEPAGLADDEPGAPGDRINRGPVEAVLATYDGQLPALTISAGHIFDDRGPLTWELMDEQGQLIDHGEVVPNQEGHHIDLAASEPGNYRLRIDNASQGFVWDYEPRGALMTLLAGGKYELARNWYDRLYFYVPQGTDAIYLAGTLMEDRHQFVAGNGEPIVDDAVEVVQDYTIVEVPAGQDGTVWSLELTSLRPEIRFLNIPGYVALSPQELLLPPELFEELP